MQKALNHNDLTIKKHHQKGEEKKETFIYFKSLRLT